MSYKVDLQKIPDWVGTAVISIISAAISIAAMWGSLKSEVQAQVTAQAVDASDIKSLISSQSRLEATVNGLKEDQEQLHQDFLSLLRRQRSK